MYNFHEGTRPKITKTSSSSFEYEDPYGIVRYTVGNGEMKSADGTDFYRIDEHTANVDKVVSSFLAKTILGELNLKKGTSTFISKPNGDIIYNGKHFSYGTKLVFSPITNDYIEGAAGMLDIYVTDKTVQVFRIDIPKEYEDDPFALQFAKDILVDEFEK